MSFYGGHIIQVCAAELKLRYGAKAEAQVVQQLEWARGRGKEREIAYWEAVLGQLTKQSPRRSRIPAQANASSPPSKADGRQRRAIPSFHSD